MDTSTKDECELAIVASEDDELILGDPVHRAYCLTYDVKNQRIGWAKPKKEEDEVKESLVESQAEFI